jgi:CRP-like cAMP-binding protein
MVSPELLRRYPFFCGLNDAEQKAIALVTEEITCESGTVLFEEGQSVPALHLLLEGSVDLSYKSARNGGEPLLVCEISAGEPFSISALIEPHTLTATARVASRSRILRIPASALRALCDADAKMGYELMHQAARVAMERLHFARVQLAAARS